MADLGQLEDDARSRKASADYQVATAELARNKARFWDALVDLVNAVTQKVWEIPTEAAKHGKTRT